jgi:hypothetical protein
MSEQEPLSKEEAQKAEWRKQIIEASKGNAIKFGSNRELRRLVEHLNNDEKVISIATGSRKNKRGRGIIVATNLRLFFLWSGYVFGENNDLPYTSLNSIEFKTGILFGEVQAFSAGDAVSYNWVGRFAGRKFVRTVRQLSTEVRQNYGANAWGQAQGGRQILPPQEQPYDRETHQAPQPQQQTKDAHINPPQSAPQQSLPQRPQAINPNLVPLPPRPLINPPAPTAFDPSQERFQIISGQMRELGVLKEAGLITDEEYEVKRKLLAEQL